MSLEKGKTLMKTFIEPQFNYCPFLSMFHSERLNQDSKIIEKTSKVEQLKFINTCMAFFQQYEMKFLKLA